MKQTNLLQIVTFQYVTLLWDISKNNSITWYSVQLITSSFLRLEQNDMASFILAERRRYLIIIVNYKQAARNR